MPNENLSQPRKTDAEAVMAVYSGQNPGRVIWQPRLEFWYAVNKKRGNLPAHLKDASLIDLYDYCHASIRYFSDPLKSRHTNVKITEKWLDEKNLHRTWQTPIGELTETIHYDEWNLSGYNFEYLLKKPEDFKIYEYVLADEEWYWDSEQLEKDQALVGNRGILNFFSRRSPIQSLFIERMGFERAVYMLMDHEEVIQRHIEVHTQADEAMYAVICAAKPPLFNFGENIDANMDPPMYWRKYLLPYYQKRTAQLHASGIKTSIHIDGAMKPLLKDIRNCPTTSIEACTPLPQGDVTLDEIEFALNGSILVDGIPAVYFLPYFPMDTLLNCAKDLVEKFHPRLILGISDEPPPDSDIERIREVGEFVAGLPL
jgi:hypothetical protein